MAADLTGMFAQLNKAIKGFDGMAQPGIDMMSQGIGNAAAAGAGLMGVEGVHSMDFMTPDAQKKEAKYQLGQLDLSTAQGQTDASKIYAKMGDVEKATALSTQATATRGKQMDALEASGAAITEEAQRKRGMQIALSRGDKEGFNAIKGGLISGADYYKAQLQSSLKRQETVAGRDPYAGAFTKDVVIDGKVTPVRFNSAGKAMAILGEGVNDFDLKPVYNPATGAEQMAMISKSNPGEIKFVGEGEKATPSYEITEEDGKFYTFMTPVGGGQPQIVSVTDTITDAEKDMAEAKAQVKTVNLIGSIDGAIAMIDQGAKVGGWYGFGEYIPKSDQRTFNALLDSIRSNVGFDALKALREGGGTLGQVSNIENLLLQSEVAKLDGYTDGRDIKASLQKIRNLTERWHMASISDNPDSLVQAEMGPDGAPTGYTMYKIDDQTMAFIAPDGSIEIEGVTQ